eukprot:1161297-Pelagomonas_calceolata.AAC.9
MSHGGLVQSACLLSKQGSNHVNLLHLQSYMHVSTLPALSNSHYVLMGPGQVIAKPCVPAHVRVIRLNAGPAHTPVHTLLDKPRWLAGGPP